MIKSICFFLLILVMITHMGYGVELDGKMKASGTQPLTVWEGDVFEAKLMIWPFVNQYESFKDDLKSITIEESIKLLKINRQGLSPNNNELYEIEGIFVLLKKPEVSKNKIKIRDLEINVNFDNLLFETTRERLLEPYIAKQNYEHFNSRYLYIIATISGFVIIIVLYILRSKQRSLRERIKENSEFDEYKKLLTMAQTREDFEKIYKLKNKWKDFVSDKEIMNQFIECMNMVQYRPVWSENDYDVVQIKTKNLENCFKESSNDL